jgi:hypothetical protein
MRPKFRTGIIPQSLKVSAISSNVPSENDASPTETGEFAPISNLSWEKARGIAIVAINTKHKNLFFIQPPGSQIRKRMCLPIYSTVMPNTWIARFGGGIFS